MLGELLKNARRIGAVATASWAFAAATVHAESFVMAHNMNADHIFHKVSERFIANVEEASGGDIEIEYHLGGDLGDWTVQFEQAMRGVIPVLLAWPHSEIDPRLDLANLGYVADNWEAAKALYGPGGVVEGVYEEIFDDLGLKLLGTIPTDFTGFVVRSGVEVPTSFPEAAKGFKMRVPPYPMAVDRYKALGFSPLPMPFSEVHTALQTGAIDGRAYSPPSEVLLFKDVLSAYVFTREHFENTFFVVNKDWFESRPLEHQEIIETAAREAAEWSWGVAEAESNGWLQSVRDAGIDVIELSPEVAEKHRQIVIDTEWPIMESILGSEMMGRIKAAVGVE